MLRNRYGSVHLTLNLRHYYNTGITVATASHAESFICHHRDAPDSTISYMPSSKILPTFELYAEQLHPLQLGYALYEPNPDLGEDEVRVGDIGYIFHGRFVRIASVFESGHGISAVDEAFHRISSFADLDSGVLSSESVRSERFELEASASVNPHNDRHIALIVFLR